MKKEIQSTWDFTIFEDGSCTLQHTRGAEKNSAKFHKVLIHAAGGNGCLHNFCLTAYSESSWKAYMQTLVNEE